VREATARRVASGRVGRTILWLWATLFSAWFLAAWFGVGLGPLLALPVGFAGALRAERRWASAVATRVLAESFAAISLGRLSMAEAALDALAASSWLAPGTRRLVAIQKGLVAVRRGDVRAARIALDEAIALPAGRGEVEAGYQRAGALALRAFALATSGEPVAALADVAAVRASPVASDDALARASLAEALVLERQGERETLRELLARDRRLLREATHPRERAIARALERMVRAAKVTPYRVAEAAPAEGDEPPVETWIARVAPSLASFAEVRRGGSGRHDLAAPAPTERGMAAVQASRSRMSAPMWPLVLLALGAFGGLTWLLTGGGGSAGMPADVGAPAASFPLAPILLLAIAAGSASGLAARWVRKRRLRGRLAAVRAAGDAQAASEDLRDLTAGEDDASAAQAHLLLADRAEREARWGDVLRETEAGIARVASPAARGATGLLAPDLVGLRAFALAVVGRADEAEAELATIAHGYPHYPRALFRVRLVQLARAGRLAEAAEQVDALAADLPLSLREELFADVVRAVGSPSGPTRAEAVRIGEELSDDPALRAWIASVAPRVLSAFEGEDLDGIAEGEPRGEDATAGAPATDTPPVRIAVGAGRAAARSGADEADVDPADVEAEAAAEAEAHQGSSRASIARRTS
jgi:hypothetical protein